MMYKEIFLINHVYVIHPHRRVPTKLCPRDEIAHPSKLLEVVMPSTRTWREFRLQENVLYSMRVEYDRRFADDLTASHLYVLTDNASISMFADAHSVGWDNEEDMLQFLEKYAHAPFAVTAPVFRLETDMNTPDIYYSVPIHTVQAPAYLALGNVVELRDLVNTRCYTVCNGLTLFLAMVRSCQWSGKIAWRALQQWRRLHPDAQENPPPLSDTWNMLYTNHPVPMIAEFPAYYGTMHPPLPNCFLPLLDEEGATPLSQFVDDTDPEEALCLFATPMTSMFPYFHKRLFNHYNPDFVRTDSTLPMFETPFGTDHDDSQFVDIEGFFIAMLRSKRAWRWWERHGALYMRRAYEANGENESFLMYCFQVLFYLYERPYYDIRYSRSRVHAMWNLILVTFDVPAREIKLFLQTMVVRNLIYEEFNIRRWHPTFPIAFLVDIMNIYRDRIDWFDVHKNRIFTTHSYEHNAVIALFAPYLTLDNEEENEYILHCSLYQLLKLDRVGFRFITRVFDRRMADRLHCVQEMFGLKKSKPTVDFPEQGAYEVGTIMMEFFRNQRGQLI